MPLPNLYPEVTQTFVEVGLSDGTKKHFGFTTRLQAESFLYLIPVYQSEPEYHVLYENYEGEVIYYDDIEYAIIWSSLVGSN